MSTFLQLVNEVERESGTINQAQRLSTVTGATGRQEKIVQWTAQAWELIQTARRDWRFMRRRFSSDLVAGQATYTAADLSITDFGGWLSPAEGKEPYSIYDPALGRGDEMRLTTVSARHWHDSYDMGANNPMRPDVIAEGYERELHLGPTPDKVYTLRGWYRRKVQILTADTDEPFIPEDFHRAIVWRALMLLAEHDEAPFPISSAQNNFRQFYSPMLREFTDPIQL